MLTYRHFGGRLTSTLIAQLCVCKAASMAAERVMRHWDLPSGVSCNYIGVWDGLATVPMADPSTTAGGTCVFRWSAACFSSNEFVDSRVDYRAVQSKIGECSGPPVAPPSRLVSALDRYFHMHSKLRVAAEAAAAEWNARPGPRADCCYLGQVIGRGVLAGHIAAPALWVPDTKAREYTDVCFRWTLYAGGTITKKDVHARCKDATVKGVSLPRWWSSARRVDAVARSVATLPCRGRRGLALPRDAVVSCRMLGAPKAIGPSPRSGDVRGPGKLHLCADSVGCVTEHMLIAQVQGHIWLCAVDGKPWEAVARNADCRGFLVECDVTHQPGKELVAACDTTKPTEALSDLASSFAGETTLEATVARYPVETTTVLALGRWHAEVLRSMRALEPNGVGHCLTGERAMAGGFEANPWRWPVEMQRLTAPVWWSWCVQAHRGASICDACWFVKCSTAENLLHQGRPPLPEGLQTHVYKAPTPWTLRSAHDAARHSREFVAESSAESQSDVDGNDEAKLETAKAQEDVNSTIETPSNQLPRKRATENDVVSNKRPATDSNDLELDEEYEYDAERDAWASWELACERADGVSPSRQPEQPEMFVDSYETRRRNARLVWKHAAMDKKVWNDAMAAVEEAKRTKPLTPACVAQAVHPLPPGVADKLGIPSAERLATLPLLKLHEYVWKVSRFLLRVESARARRAIASNGGAED